MQLTRENTKEVLSSNEDESEGTAISVSVKQKHLNEMAKLLDVDVATLLSENLIIDVKQAARLLRLSTKTIYKMVRENAIPHKKVGSGSKKRVRFLVSELIGWLKGDAVYVL